MRTTVEITSEQHEALRTIANRRGLRGFSLLVQEAIDLYLDSRSADDVGALLALRGSVGDADAAEWHRRIDETWATWSTHS